ncbi:MAG: extracellular solute-binding protein [Paracoccaceae bacterium]
MITRRTLTRLALGAAGAAMLPRGRAGLARASETGGLAMTGGLHGLSAFGELKYPAGFAHFDYVNPDAPRGGELSTGFGGVTFDSLNPFVLKGTPGLLIPNVVFDSLMAAADDEPSAYYGLLAESASLAEDRSTVVFDLHPEARFADGSPVTPDDVVWSFETLMTEGHPSYGQLLAGVDRVEAVGERAVRFTFKSGFALRDMPMLVAGVSILPKSWWQGRDFAEATLDRPMGSGPYEIAEVDPGRRLSFRRRDDYWGWDRPVNVGRWNFDTIRLEYFRDRSAAFEGFKAGSFTFQEEYWSKLWATGYNFPAINRGDVVRDTIPNNVPSGTQGFFFNLRRGQFVEREVRIAIGEAFDFEWSNRTLFFELYERTASFFEGGGELEASGLPSEAELALLEPFEDALPEGTLTEPAYVPPVTDGSGRPRKLLRQAARRLSAAGWEVVDGVRQKDGVRLEFEFLLVSGSGFARIITPYVQNLRQIGIVARLREVDPAQYKRRMDEYDFDVTTDRKAMQLTPGVELRQYFHSDSADRPGSENLAGIANPAVDAMVERVEQAESREELVTAVNALDRVLRAIHPWVPQWNKATHHLAYWDFYARPEIKPEYARGVIDTWWVDETAYAALSPKLGN